MLLEVKLAKLTTFAIFSPPGIKVKCLAPTTDGARGGAAGGGANVDEWRDYGQWLYGYVAGGRSNPRYISHHS